MKARHILCNLNTELSRSTVTDGGDTWTLNTATRQEVVQTHGSHGEMKECGEKAREQVGIGEGMAMWGVPRQKGGYKVRWATRGKDGKRAHFTSRLDYVIYLTELARHLSLHLSISRQSFLRFPSLGLNGCNRICLPVNPIQLHCHPRTYFL
jgi:hypothetical protein